MSHFEFRHLLLAGITLAAIVMTGLWSWNTLADLFGAPQAQLKHAVAALALLAALRFVPPPRQARFRRRHRL